LRPYPAQLGEEDLAPHKNQALVRHFRLHRRSRGQLGTRLSWLVPCHLLLRLSPSGHPPYAT
jgi:hypothetical protein